jgi:predicted nucleotidyltransferase
MKRVEQIKKILQDHKAVLKDEYGVVEIGLFGSYIKGYQNKASDVDTSSNRKYFEPNQIV